MWKIVLCFAVVAVFNACQQQRAVYYQDLTEEGLELQACSRFSELRRQPKILLEDGQEVQLAFNDGLAAEYGVISVFALLLCPSSTYSSSGCRNSIGPINIQINNNQIFISDCCLNECSGRYMVFQHYVPVDELESISCVYNGEIIAQLKIEKKYQESHWYGFTDPENQELQELQELDVGQVEQVDLKGGLRPMRLGTSENPTRSFNELPGNKDDFLLHSVMRKLELRALGSEQVLMSSDIDMIDTNDLKQYLLLRVWKNGEILKPNTHFVIECYGGGLQSWLVNQCIIQFDVKQWADFDSYDLIEIQLLYNSNENQDLESEESELLELEDSLIDEVNPIAISERIELRR